MEAEILRDYACSIGIDRIGWFPARDFPGYLAALAERPEYDFSYRDRRAFEEAGHLGNGWPTILVIVTDYFVEDAAFRDGYKLSNYSRFCWNTLNPQAHKIMEFLQDQNYQASLVNAPDRAAACAAGLGVIGKNCMFYVHGLGSYVGIRTIGTDWDGEGAVAQSERVTASYCDSCQRCINACPVRAIYSDGYRIDPLRCVSFLNRHSEEPKFCLPENPTLLRGWVHGCEICQAVCLMNARVTHSPRFEIPEEVEIYGVKLPNSARVDRGRLQQAVFDTSCPAYAKYLKFLLHES